MRDSTKNWLTTAAGLILLGGITFTATACAVNWDFSKLSTVTLEPNTYTLNEDFENLSIDVGTTDVTLLPSEDGECKVVCYETAKEKHSATVENGTLVIQKTDERAWYDYLSVGISESPTITVYLPKTQYSNLTIDISTGDVNLPNGFTFNNTTISGSTSDIAMDGLTADTMELTLSTGYLTLKSVTVTNNLSIKVGTGDTTLNQVSCKSLTHNSTTGGLNMKNVLVGEKMHIQKSTGDVKFERCDAGEIFIKTSTGDIEGSFLTAKVFPSDNCNILTSTGDIHITVACE